MNGYQDAVFYGRGEGNELTSPQSREKRQENADCNPPALKKGDLSKARDVIVQAGETGNYLKKR
jgi:hypothetical protein